jgi:hypothetical protein
MMMAVAIRRFPERPALVIRDATGGDLAVLPFGPDRREVDRLAHLCWRRILQGQVASPGRLLAGRGGSAGFAGRGGAGAAAGGRSLPRWGRPGKDAGGPTSVHSRHLPVASIATHFQSTLQKRSTHG